MEFLAESIGLLDLEPSHLARSHQPQQHEKTGAAAHAATQPSFLDYFTWGERSCESNNNNGEGSSVKDESADSADNAKNDRNVLEEGSGCSAELCPTQEAVLNDDINDDEINKEGTGEGSDSSADAINKHDVLEGGCLPADANGVAHANNDDDNRNNETSDHSVGKESEQEEEEEEELGESALSLMSTLTPASPMTLSASSLNLLPPLATEAKSERRRSIRINGCSFCNDPDIACQCNWENKNSSCQNNDNGGNCNNQSDPATTDALPAALPATTMPPAITENLLTKHVTQRIDGRTNGDCFTGTVDAVTGDLIHGTMIHRQTGEVYEGPFVTVNETSLRHGNNATCQYSNGMRFEGCFEYNHPKAGMWSCAGDEWAYHGPLSSVAVPEDEEKKNVIGYEIVDHMHGQQQRRNITNNNTKYGTFQASSSNGSISSSGSNNLIGHSVIGIPHPLPGSVLFHGNGLFTRPGGMVYDGEFVNGLANGVGKEVLPNGQGVYYGEFCDGLRHGVGTLVEDCYDYEDTVDELEEECDRCQCGDNDVGNDNEFLHETANSESKTTLKNVEIAASAENYYTGNEFFSNDAGNNDQRSIDPGPDFADDQRSIDPGPDFAAGVTLQPPSNICNNYVTAGITANNIASATSIQNISSTSSSNVTHNSHTTTTKPLTAQTQSRRCETCQRRRSLSRQTKTKKKQRYFSGVWCAGQYEIEDCRGTVHPESNEFKEESRGMAVAVAASSTGIATNDGVAAAAATAGTDSGGNNAPEDSPSMSVSLKRTTWDMLDEKWLGI